MMTKVYIFCFLLIIYLSSSYILTSKPNNRYIDSKLYVVEHLADCVNNPSIAEAFGGVQSEFCYQPNGLSSNQVGTLFQQIISIGFMVATYFLFKRNGLAEFIDMSERDDDDDDEWVEMGSDGTIGMRNSNKNRNNDKIDRNTQNSIKCPQCGGLGEIKFGFEMNYCDLCDGTGRVPYTFKPSSPPTLP